MPLPTKSFDTLVNNQANAMQGVAQAILDFATGTDFLSLIESNAGNSMWLQALVVSLLAVTRLQTSSGNDVDTFVGQFGLKRNPATPAFGTVTFSRATPTQQAVIPSGIFDLATKTLTTIGSEVSSANNGIIYSVYNDDANPYYNPDLVAYIIPVGINSIDVPIVSEIPGVIGNVLSNEITTIQSTLIYVDTVTNSQPLTNGTDPESDAALKIRFVLYLDSLSKATKQALEAAASGTPGVVRYKAQENYDINGNPLLGFFYFVIDDGSGNASGTLLSNVSAALNATRGFTIAYSTYAPTPFPVSITVNIVTTGVTPDATVQANVIAALQKFITGSAFDALIPYSEIAKIVYDADSTITNLTSWTLNGGTSDIQLTGKQIATVGTLTVNIL